VRDPVRQLRSGFHRLLVACLVLAACFAAAPASAQELYGSIVGVVRDGTGAFVPGATVTVVNRDTNLTKDTTTGAEGSYRILNIIPGPYDVKVTLQGFRDVSRPNVPVTIGQIARVDVNMELASVSETVMVIGESPLLQTDKSDVHTQIRSTELTSMPLNRYRNFQGLLNLAPGTTPMAFGNAETDTPARSLATNVNGQANTNNSTRTDGATNMNIWLPNHVMYVSPAETIETVDVSTSSFDAEQGMAGGAAVTVITKSGTNNFRGSAIEYFNSDKLNAKPFYFGTGAAPDKLPVKTNNYGATLGGPVRRDRVFFFGSFEGYKRRQSLFTFFSVPDEALRRGDFSRALNINNTLQTIYNPFTGNPDGTGRQPFPNNQIPTSMLNPIALKILQLAPPPNTQGFGAGGLTNNYSRQEDRSVDRENYDAKVNWNRTSAHQIWVKFSHMNAVVDDLTNYLGPKPDAEGDGGFTKVYQLTSGQTWTLRPTLLMDTTFGFSRQKQDVYGPDFNAGNFGLDVLGIPGTNDQGTGDQRYAGYPDFRLTTPVGSGFSQLGNRDGWNPIFRDERTYSIATNLTKVAGQHDLRGGYFLNFLYLDHWQPETNNPRGRFEFNGGTTALNGGPQTNNFYNQYASFLLGLIGNVSKSVQNELMTAREWQHALYFRDRWTPGPKLTFDLGLRWEYYPIMYRANGRGIDRLDLDNPDFNRRLDVIIAGKGGNPQSNSLKPGLNNFAPRLGGVYRISDNAVARAGYGLTYNAQGWARPMRGGNDYPVTIATQFFNNDPFAYYGTFQQGLPLIVGPDLSSGRIPLDRAAAFWTPEPGNIDRGYVHTWNIAFERRLPYDISVDAAYVGARGRGGYAGLDVNAPLTLGVGPGGRPYAPLGRRIEIWSWGQRLRTQYNSLQVGMRKPFTHGFLFKGAYTLAKAMNESDGDGATTLWFNTPSEVWRNWGPAGFDRRHNFQLGFVYALPWQSTNGYGSIGKALASDWQVNGTFGAFSGNPFTMTSSGTTLNTPSNNAGGTAGLNLADLVGSYNVAGRIGAEGAWFDTTQFAQPTGVRFGNTGRNQFYGPGGVNLDLSLFRAFPMGGQKRLEARVEMGNIFNTGVFANPQGNVTSGSFGVITAVANNNGAAFYPERQVRLGIRYSF
jgi:hypothetical protein